MPERARSFVTMLVVGVSISGCGIADRDFFEEYAGLQAIEFASSDRQNFFRIYDNPVHRKLVLEPRFRPNHTTTEARQVSGVQTILPVPVYERAARDYLFSTGRPCTLVDGYPVSHPVWLFQYSCGPPQSQMPTPKRPP
jgi:hypothetical protein